MDIQKILKSDYLDILFDGRNKVYGGYELRKRYPRRLRNAAILLFSGTMLLSAYPIIAGILNKDAVRVPPIITGPIVLNEPPPIDKTKPEPLPLPSTPPPPVKPTVEFKAPLITEDDVVSEQDKFTAPPSDTVAIGFETRDGVKDGIDVPGDVVARKGNGDGMVETDVKEEIFTKVEQMPAFDGDLSAYLLRHLNYPEQAREAGSEGRAIIHFVVNEDGSISGVEVARTAGSSALDAEASRVVAGMPRWKPGKQQGKAVKVYYNLPIAFRLD